MPVFHCRTCAAQFPPADEPPAACPICDDERQYVPETGQQWTTAAELAADHRHEVRDDNGLVGVGIEPGVAIGQRALLVPLPDGGNLMWDCLPLIGDDAVEQVRRRGGLAGIAISHPHYYTGMADWARAFDCPIHLHADDAEWITRPDDHVELWDGETKPLADGVTLIRCGGHYAGGTVLHWRDGNALLSGDIVQVIPDRAHVAFMYSYPNLIPLPVAAVEAIGEKLAAYDYDVIYGAWWDRVVERDGKGAVERSVARYRRAVAG